MSEVIETKKAKRGRPRKQPINHQIEEPRYAEKFVTPSNTRGFSGKAVKIKLYREDGQHDHSDPWVALSLGDLPTVWVCRGFDWIIPEELLSVLQDTAVPTFEMIARRYPDANGNVYDTREIIKNRFPYQVLGEATWDEYEAFRAKLANNKGPVNAN